MCAIWNIVAKILRLSHWVVARGILSPSQAGFSPLKGCEDHVFSLLELIKAKWRDNRPLYALFVDLKRAYDTVNPQALWAVLCHMGVPDNMLSVLRDWSQKRVTSMTRDGVKSEPWRMVMGVGQGDVLSPLLFNLYIESLGRHIAALPNYAGVTIGIDATAVTVKELKYADDICNPAEEPGVLQLVASETKAWCDAWGMMIGLGAKKTELVAFIPPRAVNVHPPLPLITINGTPIEWVTEYRYLGLELRNDLSENGAVAAIASKLSAQWQRYFHSSRLIRHHSPALILQLFKTVVLGSTNYLLAIANPSAAATKAINTATLKAIRSALRLSPTAPNTLVWAEGRAPRGEAIMARERFRFATKMRTTPFRDTDIAPRIFRALSASFEAGSNISHTHCSLTHRIMQLELDYAACGIPVPASSFLNRSRDAAAFGRRVGLYHWINEGRALDAARPMASDPLRPPAGPPTLVASYFNNYYDLDINESGGNKYTTHFGVRGPGCCGAILAQVSRISSSQTLQALAAVRSGVAGMFAAPLAAPGRRASDYCIAAKRASALSGSKRARVKAASARHLHDSHHCSATCPNCDDPVADPYHVLVQCSHPAVAYTRKKILEGIPAFLEQLVLQAMLPRPLLQRLTMREQFHEIARRQGIATDVRSLAEITDWQSPDGRFSLFHLLAVATWPWRAVVQEELRLSRALAGVFRACEVKNHHSRPLANYWVNWAGRSIFAIFCSWNDVAALRVPPIPDLLFVSTSTGLANAKQEAEVDLTVPRRSLRARFPSRRMVESDISLPVAFSIGSSSASDNDTESMSSIS